MAKERKSPQEKKRLDYTRNHFTFANRSSRAFPKVWKRKKTQVNRSFRRKGEGLLSQAKTGIAAEDAAVIGEEVTTSGIHQFHVRKRLHKLSTVSVGEKVRLKLEKRSEMVGRRVQSHRKYDRLAASAVFTLTSLTGDQLAEVAHRASRLCHFCDQQEIKRLRRSNDPIDQALEFFHNVSWGSAREKDALRRTRLCQAWSDWIDSANRILERDRRPIEKKVTEKLATEKRLKAMYRATKPARYTQDPDSK